MMEELAEMEEEKSIPVTNKTEPIEPVESRILSFEKEIEPAAAKSTSPTSMSFKVQGDLNLELQFDIGGKTIMLEVSESGLNIQMEGGVRFSVPVSGAQSHKKAV